MSEALDIFEKFGSLYYQLTASEKKIADYVMQKKSQVEFMSISELSEETGVSEATISRFCKNLGLRSYNEFKLELARAQVGIDLSKDEGEEELEFENRLSNDLINSYTNALRQSISLADPEDYRAAVNMMINARIVVCMGQGGSMIIAEEAAHVMSTVSPKFFAIRGSHVQTMKIAQLDEQDVVFFFSYSGSTKEIVELMTLAKSRGLKIILVTRFKKSPGAKLADVVLLCGTDEGPLQLSSMSAMVSNLIVVDILYREYCHRNEKDTLKRKETVAKALAERHI